MVVVIKRGTSEKQLAEFCRLVENEGVNVHLSRGMHTTIVGLVGDVSRVDVDTITALPYVESIKRITEPYKNANRKFKPDDTVITVRGVKIGGGHVPVIAGPCSVESEEQICEVALAVKKAGASMLRGGAFKPRTSPYAFQGLRAEGIELLCKARELTGLPIVTEIMSSDQLPLFEEVDVIQVGARNMQNFELLKLLGKTNKPILLKRGLANTIEELLMSAEYIMAGGNEQVILCERGIRTFETSTRNTLDISAVPMLHQLTHLPVVVDPSHAAGISWMVRPLSLSAVAAGCDGLIIEVHNNPEKALSDGPQSLRPDDFAALMTDIRSLAEHLHKKV